MISIRSINPFEYLAPDALADALEILEAKGKDGKILNGGTDLVLQMKQGLIHPSSVVDIKRIPELNILKWDESDGFRIGSAVPIDRILSYTSLPKEYGILMQAVALIGSMQIKNRGTIGGNVCNAAPSADSAPALLCLDAGVVLTSVKGTRTVPLDAFFIGPGQTLLNGNEILLEIIVPTPSPGSAGCYLRHTTRAEMDIAVTGVASWLDLSSQDNQVKAVRIALGAVAPTPIRANHAEEALMGKPVTSAGIEEAAETAGREAEPISDLRGSAQYRRELVRVLTRRTLKGACEGLGIQI